jgi:hypothetical protein
MQINDYKDQRTISSSRPRIAVFLFHSASVAGSVDDCRSQSKEL